uniref:Nucleolus and neural progenitor protein-like N-terminal domain-containing protein n=1 Tax=Oryza brachyantha TaxID=4533 RepID=J3MYZ0_ORYBR
MAQRQVREGKGEGEEEDRLRGALRSLQQEAGVLERLVYKHRNQHRGAAYFQYLLRVRRDVKLLLATGLGDVLTAVSPVVASRKPANTILVVGRQGKKKPGANHSHHERLLGVARLLSEMAEPVMKGAVQISFLLARSFFVDLCTAVLALLARVRVLVQQMLLDVVSIYNKATDLIDKKQSVKISIGGAEAFREYYPSSNDAHTFLECIWVKDKFILHEKTKDNCEKVQNDDQNSCASKLSVLYETLGQVSEDIENAEGWNSPTKQPDAILANQPETTHLHHEEDSQSSRQLVNDNGSDSLSDPLATNVHLTPCPDVKPETKKRVAFIAVGNSKVTASSIGTTSTKKQRLDVIPHATAEPEDLYGKFSEDTDKSIF